MKALHVVAGLDPKHGGPSYSVPRLCLELRRQDCEITILTVGQNDGRESAHTLGYEQDYAKLPLVRSLRMSRQLRSATSRYAHRSDLVHAHGLWLMPNVYAGVAAERFNVPLIVSPRGMLAPEALKFSPWKKQLFWKVLQQHAYADAAAWHATSEAEASDIRAFGITAPIAVVPNGVDLPDLEEQFLVSSRRTLLFLSRLHPKKMLPNLITAWGQVAAKRPDWDLLIVGPDEAGHRSELQAQASQERAKRIFFRDPVFGNEKAALLASADLFVLPTANENFGIAVAEALGAGVPAIVSKGAPWSGLETNRCGWWIDHGIGPLQDALLEATGLPSSELRQMGSRGRAWMNSDFSWGGVALRMRLLYQWATGASPRPSFVLNQ